jgi:processive 1,2-diacylglycerol beta-glucosyltransferase
MKIIIAYASAGAGHRRAAEALYNYLKENSPGTDLKIVDVLQKSNFVFRSIYSKGYIFLVNHALWLWHFCFWFTSIKFLRPATKAVNFLLNRVNVSGFYRFLTKESPDFIISTHFLPSEIAVNLKKTRKINSRLITVITDFGVHPFWVLDGTDTYIAASSFTKEQLTARGVKDEIIKDLGIPIDPRFLKAYDRNTLCYGLGLEPGKFTVLISTGSSGIGDVAKIVDALYEEVQVIVVCGQNKALYAILSKRGYIGVKVYGFTDNMHELMAVSDIIITKPGGMTIAESLAMGLFPVFIAAIPGQETENARILSENSIGADVKDTSAVKGIVLSFRDNPDKLMAVRERINALKKPYAAKEICNAIR